MGWYERHGRRRPPGDLGPQSLHRGWRDPVWSAQQRQRLLVLAPLVVVVGHDGLAVEQGQQLACLAVGGRCVGVLAAEHKPAGQVPGDRSFATASPRSNIGARPLLVHGPNQLRWA